MLACSMLKAGGAVNGTFPKVDRSFVPRRSQRVVTHVRDAPGIVRRRFRRLNVTGGVAYSICLRIW
jgi:hypothetical protein